MRRECLTIIGTAHVSEESVNEVKDTIYEQHPDVVAIELDRGRYIKLKKQMAGIEEDETISVSQIIRENKVGLFFTSTLLGYFQSKIGADLDVAPGSEMIGAIEACEDLEIPIALIDREISTTLQRALNKMGVIEKSKFLFGLIASVFGFGDEEDIDDKIKRNLLTDFKVISILEIVEDAFDEIDYRCFRLYHLLKGMTYKKLREITRIPNCKARVVKINKWLRDNVREQDIIRTFEDIYDE